MHTIRQSNENTNEKLSLEVRLVWELNYIRERMFIFQSLCINNIIKYETSWFYKQNNPSLYFKEIIVLSTTDFIYIYDNHVYFIY